MRYYVVTVGSPTSGDGKRREGACFGDQAAGATLFVAAEYCDPEDAWDVACDTGRALVGLDRDGVIVTLDCVDGILEATREAPEYAAALEAWKAGDDRAYGRVRAVEDAEVEVERAFDEHVQETLDRIPGARDEFCRTLFAEGFEAAFEWLNGLASVPKAPRWSSGSALDARPSGTSPSAGTSDGAARRPPRAKPPS